jgi:hypothetical protein
MNLPRINAMFIVSHDETIPPMRLRFVEIDDVSYFLARDVAENAGIPAEEDGDYRLTLATLNIPFIESEVHDRGTTFGPVTLIDKSDVDRLSVVRTQNAR